MPDHGHTTISLTVRTELPHVTRVEVIDHDPALGDDAGRQYGKRNAKDVLLSLQDDGRTLKVFVR